LGNHIRHAQKPKGTFPGWRWGEKLTTERRNPSSSTHRGRDLTRLPCLKPGHAELLQRPRKTRTSLTFLRKRKVSAARNGRKRLGVRTAWIRSVGPLLETAIRGGGRMTASRGDRTAASSEKSRVLRRGGLLHSEAGFQKKESGNSRACHGRIERQEKWTNAEVRLE